MRDKKLRTEIAKAVIDELGGIKAVMQIFPDISQPAISFWKIRGLPVEKERYLRSTYPNLSIWSKYEFKAGLSPKLHTR